MNALLPRPLLGLVMLVAAIAGAGAAEPSADIRAAQEALSNQDYEPGDADGVFGEKTEQAIRQYQADWQLEETGALTLDLLQRLKRTHPATSVRFQQAANQDCQVYNRPQARETLEYVGNCVDGKAEGEGTITWRYFKGGKWQTSNCAGGFKAGKLDGHGLCVYADKDRYEGDFRDGEYNGRGIYEYANGARYEGDFRDDEFNGQGILEYASGSRYEGEWRDDMRHGHGVFVLADGTRFEGEWREGTPNGPGSMTDTSGKTYTGDWKNGCLSEGSEKLWIATTREACGF